MESENAAITEERRASRDTNEKIRIYWPWHEKFGIRNVTTLIVEKFLRLDIICQRKEYRASLE